MRRKVDVLTRWALWTFEDEGEALLEHQHLTPDAWNFHYQLDRSSAP